MVFSSVQLLTALTDDTAVTHANKWQLLAGWLLFKAARLRFPRHKKNKIKMCCLQSAHGCFFCYCDKEKIIQQCHHFVYPLQL